MLYQPVSYLEIDILFVKMRDLKNYRQQTNRHLFIGFFIILFFVGISLIALIYGVQAALMGVVCLIVALVPMGLVWLVLILMDWIVHRTEKEKT